MNERQRNNSENFGEAEFITTVHHLPTMLICPSPTKQGHFYLYQKNKSKRLSNGAVVSYFECSTCTKLGDQKGRVSVRENSVMNNPDLGHNMLCSPYDRESMEALKLERRMLELCLARVHPRQSYTQVLASIGDKFDDLSFRECVALKISPFKSLRSSLYRSYRRGRLESTSCLNPSSLLPEHRNRNDDLSDAKADNENDWNRNPYKTENSDQNLDDDLYENNKGSDKKCKLRNKNKKKREVQNNKRFENDNWTEEVIMDGLNEKEDDIDDSISNGSYYAGVEKDENNSDASGSYGKNSTQKVISPETVDELLLQFIMANEGISA